MPFIQLTAPPSKDNQIGLIILSISESLFDDEEKKKMHGGVPICHSCQAPLTKKPGQYKLNKMAQHFQAYAGKLTKALEQGKRFCGVISVLN